VLSGVNVETLVKSEPSEAYRKRDIDTVIYNNFGLVAPDIIEHVHHNLDGLVPY
jgi:hypothetical protein